MKINYLQLPLGLSEIQLQLLLVMMGFLQYIIITYHNWTKYMYASLVFK